MAKTGLGREGDLRTPPPPKFNEPIPHTQFYTQRCSGQCALQCACLRSKSPSKTFEWQITKGSFFSRDFSHRASDDFYAPHGETATSIPTQVGGGFHQHLSFCVPSDPGGGRPSAATEEKAQKHLISTKQISEQSAKIITFYDLAGHPQGGARRTVHPPKVSGPGQHEVSSRSWGLESNTASS